MHQARAGPGQKPSLDFFFFLSIFYFLFSIFYSMFYLALLFLFLFPLPRINSVTNGPLGRHPGGTIIGGTYDYAILHSPLFFLNWFLICFGDDNGSNEMTD